MECDRYLNNSVMQKESEDSPFSISPIPPRCIKTQSHLFLLRIHAVNRQLFCFARRRDGVGEKPAPRKEEKGKGKQEQGVFYDAVDFSWGFVKIHRIPLICSTSYNVWFFSRNNACEKIKSIV